MSASFSTHQHDSSLNEQNKNEAKGPELQLPWMLIFLTIKSLWRGVTPMVELGHWDPLSIATCMCIIAGVVIAVLWVFFQFLGQIGSRCAGGNVVFVTMLRNFQLLDKTHWPERQPATRSYQSALRMSEPGLSGISISHIRISTVKQVNTEDEA